MPSQVDASLIQDALAVDAGRLVGRDDALATGHAGGGVEAQPRVDLGRDAARHDLQDFAAETDQDLVDHRVHRRTFLRLDHLLEQIGVIVLLHRFEDQRRVGRGVGRLVLIELFEIAAVGDHGGELFELVELVHDEDLPVSMTVWVAD